MEPIGVALVGYGLAGKVFHAPLIAATPGLSLDLVVSSDAAKVHRDYPEVAVASDFGAALADERIGLVVLATPDTLHAPQARAALGALKHVVVDKPFAPTLLEARELTAAAGRSGRSLSIFHNRRWDADFLTLRRLIDEGTLGDIVQFESHFDRHRPDIAAGWKEERAAGIWQDLGPHLIDQAVSLFGMPDAVFLDIGTLRPGGTAPDYAHALLRYANTRVILHMSKLVPRNDLRFAVHGTHGSYIKHGIDPQEDQAKAGYTPAHPDWGIDPVPGALWLASGDAVQPAAIVENERGDYPAFYRALKAALRSDGAGPVPADEALAAMIVLEAGLISTREGREVRIGELTG